MSNKLGRNLYKRRQAIIERVFGQIKDVREIRSFMRKGKPAADSDCKPICATHSPLRLYRNTGIPPGTCDLSG